MDKESTIKELGIQISKIIDELEYTVGLLKDLRIYLKKTEQ